MTVIKYRSGTDFRNRDLRGANFLEVSLEHADFRNANLEKAHFEDASLKYADFRGANLTDADLSWADLTGAIINETTKGINDKCPKTGSFTAYKKCIGLNRFSYIVELEIPEDARRSSSTSNKCRCDKAKVISITKINGDSVDIKEVRSWYDSSFKYRVGETVIERNFDERYWLECSRGIHFFMSRNEAVEYLKPVW